MRWENLIGLEGWRGHGESKVGPVCGCGQRSLREHEEGGLPWRDQGTWHSVVGSSMKGT